MWRRGSAGTGSRRDDRGIVVAMRPVAAVLLGIIWAAHGAGCSSDDPCGRIVRTAEKGGLASEYAESRCREQPRSMSECQADCVEDATCEEMDLGAAGYYACLDACLD